MEDLKQIQEFFSKPIKENSRRSPDFILTEPAEIKYTESFGSGIKAPGVLHHANEGAFLGAEGAYIIVLPGGTFYVDEDKEEAIRIYPLKDQSRELQLALDYTPFSPKYETWKSWVKEPKTLEEAYIVTYAKNKGEKPSSAAYKLRGSALAFMKDLEKDGYITMLSQKPVDGVDESLAEASKGALNYFNDLKYYYQKAFRYLDVEEREEYKQLAKDFFSNLQIDNKVRAVGLEEYNSGIYYDPAKERNAVKAKQASKSGLEKVRDFVKKVMKEEEITVDDATEFKLNLKHLLDKHIVKGEALSDYEEKEADYDKLYSDYAYKAVKEVATQKGFSKYLKSKDNPKGETSGLDTKTMNKILMNVIKDIEETKRLGEGVIEEELCAKGKAYRKKRMAAGEKSSAYLSGRAVKVCKGQMKG